MCSEIEQFIRQWKLPLLLSGAAAQAIESESAEKEVQGVLNIYSPLQVAAPLFQALLQRVKIVPYCITRQ